jgi:hypothetical protein
MINTRKEREREREREKERQKKNIMFNTTKRDATKRLLKMYSIFALENSKKNRKFSL